MFSSHLACCIILARIPHGLQAECQCASCPVVHLDSQLITHRNQLLHLASTRRRVTPATTNRQKDRARATPTRVGLNCMATKHTRTLKRGKPTALYVISKQLRNEHLQLASTGRRVTLATTDGQEDRAGCRQMAKTGVGVVQQQILHKASNVASQQRCGPQQSNYAMLCAAVLVLL
jgi:hypothetical protein